MKASVCRAEIAFPRATAEGVGALILTALRIVRAPALKCPFRRPFMNTENKMEAAHILVVDDDVAIRELVREYLVEHDLKVSLAATGAEMDKVLAAEIVDLVVLDLKLPDADGLAIARRLRDSLDIPIIMLTGRKEEADRIMGLELGADDYVTKPFSQRELLARIKAVLRRTEGKRAKRRGESVRAYRFSGWELNTGTRKLRAPDGHRGGAHRGARPAASRDGVRHRLGRAARPGHRHRDRRRIDRVAPGRLPRADRGSGRSLRRPAVRDRGEVRRRQSTHRDDDG